MIIIDRKIIIIVINNVILLDYNYLGKCMGLSKDY